jgi:carboxymethylenebutenolidase
MLKAASMSRVAGKFSLRHLTRNKMIQKNHILTISLIAGFLLISTSIQVQSEHVGAIQQNTSPREMAYENWHHDHASMITLVDTESQNPVAELEESFDIEGKETTEAHEHSIAYFPPPLQQIKNGVKATDVTCTEGLELVLKQSNGQPACIKPSSVAKLIERGWAIHVLPDYVKNENNNSAAFSVGEYTVQTESVNYFQNAQGYLARPTIDGEFPAVTMIHENLGITDNIKEMAKKLASHGYIVLAVDLYDGKIATTTDEARIILGTFEQQQWTDNMNSAVRYLEERFGVESIGSIGWCFGGGQSLNLALNNPNMDATVIYYGRLVTDPSELSKISWPVLGIFAGLDTGIPEQTVREFESALNDLGIENEIIIYPGVKHGFANPSGDRHAPEESEDAWEKTLDFFETNLK